MGRMTIAMGRSMRIPQMSAGSVARMRGVVKRAPSSVERVAVGVRAPSAPAMRAAMAWMMTVTERQMRIWKRRGWSATQGTVAWGVVNA